MHRPLRLFARANSRERLITLQPPLYAWQFPHSDFRCERRTNIYLRCITRALPLSYHSLRCARSWTGNHEISEMSLDGQRPARVGARGDEQPALLVRAVLR